ncbi:hypothetical protein [Breznakia sp. PF5-3]|uniref:hypothetical protein n=2 Tax=Breznakia TaxID=1854458 RepID=UPI002405AA9D|nr:hypothetical protein [Breznakia sp. PF5-3]
MKRKMFKSFMVMLSIFSVFSVLTFSFKADASSYAVLSGNIDLKGYDATITTQKDGSNILSTKKGTYLLNENAVIYSSRDQKIYLNNTVPVNVNSIYTKKDLEFRGSGALNANTADEFGINVGGHLKAFKYTKNGVGTVSATGTTAGIRVYNEIQMEGGSISGYGINYGIWCYNDIKPYYSASIYGYASGADSTGIWAYRDIYAWKGATVSGEGGSCGARTQIAHIQAEGAGSSITGISRNIYSGVSALQADKQMLRAYCGAMVQEIYLNSGLVVTDDVAVDVTAMYPTVNRNMCYMGNYQWYSEPAGIYYNGQGLIGDPYSANFKDGNIVGYRTNEACCKGKEATQLKKSGTHKVVFSNAATYYTEDIIIRHWVDTEGLGEEYRVYKEEVVTLEVGTTIVIEDYKYKFGDLTESSYQGADRGDFVLEKSTDPVVINYYYTAEIDF